MFHSGRTHNLLASVLYEACVTVEFVRVVSPATFPSPQWDNPPRWWQAWSHTKWQELFSFTALLSERISLSFNPTRSFIHASPDLCPSTPPTGLHPPLHSSTPFHLYSILRAAHPSFVAPCHPPFSLLISLYLAPCSCSSISETMRSVSFWGRRSAPTKATMIRFQGSTSTDGEGKGRVCCFNRLSWKSDQVKPVLIDLEDKLLKPLKCVCVGRGHYYCIMLLFISKEEFKWWGMEATHMSPTWLTSCSFPHFLPFVTTFPPFFHTSPSFHE